MSDPVSNTTDAKDGYTRHLEYCFEQTLARCQEAYDRIHSLHGSIAPMGAEIEKLRKYVAELEAALLKSAWHLSNQALVDGILARRAEEVVHDE